jgi:hypothetical protein
MARLCPRIVGSERLEYADPPHPIRLLRARPQWPRNRTAEHCDELASFHCLSFGSLGQAKFGFQLRPSKQERASSEMGRTAAMCAAKSLGRV